MAKKVLVVDDEKLIVKGIRFSLEQDGMEVDCAYDGEEALKMATENQYDMILLDIMLPKMDGFEVCQHIREFSDMPIVMLTAKGDDMDKQSSALAIQTKITRFNDLGILFLRLTSCGSPHNCLFCFNT